MPNYEVTIGERTVRVILRRDGDAVFARVEDGPEMRVQLQAPRPPLHTLGLGDRRMELLARRNGQVVDVAMGGLAYHAEVVDEAHARLAQLSGAKAAGHGRRELKAPMPGLVVRVLAEPGQAVEAHQPLVVLQAMKMENELSLPRAGIVSAVSAQSGQTVEAGQVLIALEE